MYAKKEYLTNHLERTIISLLALWPCLYKERGHILNHLFCTIGNGYEWIEGRLELFPPELYFFGSDEDFEKNLRKTVKERNKQRVEKGKKFKTTEFYKLFSKIKEHKSNVVQSWEQRYYQKWFSPIIFDMEKLKIKSQQISISAAHIYPIAEEYSAIFTIPDNVTPEYVRGAVETITMVLSTQPKDPDKIRYDKTTVREHTAENQEKALKALKRINEK